MENVLKLAALQDDGDIPAAAEDSIALLFAERHASRLRYVAAWGWWLSYDGSCWVRDETLHAFDLARAICREIAADCEKAANAVASAKTVAAVERLAKADRRLAATASQWDADCALLNTGGDEGAATYDLIAGTSREPSPLDYITKRTACPCAPAGTPHPLWSDFLERVTDGNAELQRFLQRYAGYCCTGFTREHVFVFAYGTGANGKSTFINTIAGVLGGYVAISDMSTFMASTTPQHPTDLAKLRGARLVVAQETQGGRRWDESKIKALTGGDTITARFMRQDFFDFVPTFKLFICGNHKPRLTSVDQAMRRRLLLVPFTVQIPPAERDPQLFEKLKAEWPAILRWCVDGCAAWRQGGLLPPPAVRDATEAYFASQDTLQHWLEDCTTSCNQTAVTRTADLFASWKAWAEDHNIKPGSAQTLSEALADRGFVRDRNTTGQRGFRNLALKT
jgi:putative DNA primase/helicase